MAAGMFKPSECPNRDHPDMIVCGLCGWSADDPQSTTWESLRAKVIGGYVDSFPAGVQMVARAEVGALLAEIERAGGEAALLAYADDLERDGFAGVAHMLRGRAAAQYGGTEA